MKKSLFLAAMVLLSGNALYSKVYSVEMYLGNNSHTFKFTIKNKKITNIQGAGGAQYTPKLGGKLKGAYQQKKFNALIEKYNEGFALHVKSELIFITENPPEAVMDAVNLLLKK